MSQGLRRLVRTLGLRGAVLLLGAVWLALRLLEGTLSWVMLTLVPGTVMAFLLLFSTAATWGTYRRSGAVTAYREVIGPLVTSRKEFALLLRPFGHDGEVLLLTGGRDGRASRWAGSLTLEQVVSTAVRDVLGLDTYAVVDSALTLAPPGPVYLRAQHSEWKVPVRALIRRAHTVFILLPPGQDLRPSLAWEVAEIVRAGRQDRVIVVMPPSRRGDRVDGELLARGAAVAVALLRRRHLDEVTPEECEAVVRGFPSRNIFLIGVGDDPRGVRLMMLQPGAVRRWWQWGPRRLTDTAMRDGLRQVLRSKDDAWRGRDFDQRYPWHPGGPGPADLTDLTDLTHAPHDRRPR
ncbi:MAG TPA: hypothetical protein VI248_08345 [Kineosporiaceae bacterium]